MTVGERSQIITESGKECGIAVDYLTNTANDKTKKVRIGGWGLPSGDAHRMNHTHEKVWHSKR